MARQVLPIVGAVIGSFFPGAGTQIGFMIGSMLGNAIDPQVIKGPSIGEGQQTTSQEGQPRPIIWGKGCVGGNIIDKGELKKRIVENEQGKGGGPIVEEERLSMTYALRICEGPIEALLRVWEDEKLVFDARTEGALVTPDENAEYQRLFRFYKGDETQLPDPDLEVIHGVGNTPAYRGTAYIVFPNRDVTDRRGSVANYRFEVASSATITEYPDIINNTLQGDIGDDRDSASVTGPSLMDAGSGFLQRDAIKFSKTGQYAAWYSDQGGSNIGWRISRLSDSGEGYGADLGWITPSNPQRWRAVTWHSQENILVCIRQHLNAFSQILGFFRVIGDSFQLVSESSPINTITPAGVSFNPGGFKCIIYAGGYNNHVASFDSATCTLANITMVDESLFPADIGTGYQGIVSWRNDNQTVSAGRATSQQLRLNTINSNNTVTNAAFLSDGFGYDTVFCSDDGVYVYVLKYTLGTPGNIIRIFTINPTPSGPTSHEFVEVTGVVQPPSVFSGSDHNASKDMVMISINSVGQSSPWLGHVNGPTVTPFSVQPTSSNGSHWQFTNALGFTAVPGYWPLASVILDIADRLQIPASKLDLTDISDIQMAGLVAAGDYAGGNIIRSLQDVYFFDPSDYDKQMHFRKRGKPVVTTVTVDDMVVDSYEYTRESAIEYPRKIELMYQNARIGYAAAKATVERISPDVKVSGDIRLEVPVVLTEDEAAQVADKQLKVAWADAEGEIVFSLPCSYEYLTPGDAIGVVMRQSVRRLRMDKFETADGMLKITGKIDRQSAYTSDVTGIPLPDPTPPPPTIVGDTILAYLNIPALIDSNDFLGYYVAGAGQTESWYGAVVQRRSFDDDWEQVARINRGTCIGLTQTALTSASEHYPDTTNRIRVQLYNMGGRVPQEVSQGQLLRENNGAALCREDGTAEIVQFRDVNEVSAGVYDLTYLIRGRLNSVADAHASGVLFVLLDGVVPVSTTTSDIGVTFTHRAVSLGQSPEDAEEREDTYQPAMMQVEFPVDLLRGYVDSAGMINVSWSPRERFGTDINPVRSQHWLNYHVNVTDGTSSVDLDTLSPSAIIDGSAFTGTVTITVTQVNRYTGQGPARTIEMEL